MSKHTPGPWDFRPHGTAIYVAAGKVGYRHRVCVVDTPDVIPALTDKAAEANARLIAAAPDLLAHLQFAVDLFTAMPMLSGTAQVEAMRAAIAKATGKPTCQN